MQEPTTALDDDPIVTSNEFADSIDHSPRTVQRWRTTGEGPAYIKLGKRVFYQRSVIQAWLRGKTIANTRIAVAGSSSAPPASPNAPHRRKRR